MTENCCVHLFPKCNEDNIEMFTNRQTSLNYDFFLPFVLRTHPQGSGLHGVINPGIGSSHIYGSSGAGCGGRGGRGDHSAVVGAAYGDLYEPVRFGSSGGGDKSGRGGGVIWFNVTNVIQIDGEVSADGRKGDNSGSGGGSGGSIWMHCYRMKGVKIYFYTPDICFLTIFVNYPLEITYFSWFRWILNTLLCKLY